MPRASVDNDELLVPGAKGSSKVPGYGGHVQLSSGAPRVGLHSLASRLHSLSGERRIPMTITAFSLLLDTHRNNALMMLSFIGERKRANLVSPKARFFHIVLTSSMCACA